MVMKGREQIYVDFMDVADESPYIIKSFDVTATK